MVYTSHLRYIWGILGMALLLSQPLDFRIQPSSNPFSMPTLLLDLADDAGTDSPEKVGDRKGRGVLTCFNHRKISI